MLQPYKPKTLDTTKYKNFGIAYNVEKDEIKRKYHFINFVVSPKANQVKLSTNVAGDIEAVQFINGTEENISQNINVYDQDNMSLGHFIGAISKLCNKKK